MVGVTPGPRVGFMNCARAKTVAAVVTSSTLMEALLAAVQGPRPAMRARLALVAPPEEPPITVRYMGALA
jgi:hypothetical protein